MNWPRKCRKTAFVLGNAVTIGSRKNSESYEQCLYNCIDGEKGLHIFVTLVDGVDSLQF